MGLAPDEMAAVRRLATTCEEAGGQDLKVVLRPAGDAASEGHEPTQFVAVSGGEVVGYAGADRGEDVEICGMVHPAHRRTGMGAALLQETLAAARAMGRDTALVICEDAAPVAFDWMRRLGGHLDSSELRMVLRLDPRDPADRAATPVVTLRKSSPGVRPVLRHLLREGFPETDDANLDRMLSQHDSVEEESLIAWDGDRPVATVRLIEDTPERSMVYGLVVDSRFRGQGFGAATMRAALAHLSAAGATEVSLEVLPDNEPAVRLYRGLGFKEVTTYRYMRVHTDKVSAANEQSASGGDLR